MSGGDLTQTLWDLAISQRWFSGRSGRPLRVDLGDWAAEPTPSTPGLRPGFLVVGFDDGHEETYLIPLLWPLDGDPSDATDDAGILLDLLRADAPGFERLAEIPDDLPARRFTGEQSNTSIFYGEALLAKVFRRIEPGSNVDVELHRELRGSGVVAELYGAWNVDGTDLAVFLEALHEPTDGYDLACRFASEGRDFSEHATALGSALGTVHRILAEKLDTGSVPGADIAAGFRSRFETVASEFAELRPFVPAAERVFDEVADTQVEVQRVHGDCHLGQVLLTGGHWIYVDFEGEPLKSLEERRRPDSPLRDVAGMLRSFGYARAAGDADDDWLTACRRAFLTGYGLDPDRIDPLLAGYETDKAGYEVAYEARYRPHLIRVPLDFLSTLPEGA